MKENEKIESFAHINSQTPPNEELKKLVYKWTHQATPTLLGSGYSKISCGTIK